MSYTLEPVTVCKTFIDRRTGEMFLSDDEAEYGRNFIEAIGYNVDRLKKAGKKTTVGAVLRAFSEVEKANTSDREAEEFKEKYKGFTITALDELDGEPIIRVQKVMSDPEKAWWGGGKKKVLPKTDLVQQWPK